MVGRVYLPGRKNGRRCPEESWRVGGNEEGRRGRGGSGCCSGCLTVFAGFEESVGGVFVEERSWRVWKVL